MTEERRPCPYCDLGGHFVPIYWCWHVARHGILDATPRANTIQSWDDADAWLHAALLGVTIQSPEKP